MRCQMGVKIIQKDTHILQPNWKISYQIKPRPPYIFLLYSYDSNTIHSEPIKSRHASEILKAYQTVHQRLTQAGLIPQLHTLDNEASTILKQYLHQEQVEFQLMLPHIHRRNAAERAIRTFKNHFLAALAGTDPEFPLHLWCRLLP